jgi:hypothetical protein
MLTLSFLQLALCCLLNAFQMREAICAVQRNLYNRPLVSSSAGPSHVSCASLRTQILEIMRGVELVQESDDFDPLVRNRGNGVVMSSPDSSESL